MEIPLNCLESASDNGLFQRIRSQITVAIGAYLFSLHIIESHHQVTKNEVALNCREWTLDQRTVNVCLPTATVVSKFMFAVLLAKKNNKYDDATCFPTTTEEALQFVSRAKVTAQLLFRCQTALFTVHFVIFLLSVTVLSLQAR